MKGMISWAGGHPVFANLIMVGLLIGGIAAGKSLRREMFPELALDRIIITVPYPHATPEETEESICKQIERELEGLEGIKKIDSTASENVGTVLIELEPEADSAAVLNEVRNKVDSIDTFPEDAEEPQITELFQRTQVINLVVYGEAPERSLKEIAREIKDELLLLPGITQVQWSGVREYEISIEISEAALQEYGLSLAEVARAVKGSSINLPGGTLRNPEEQIKLQTVSRKYSGGEYEEIPLVARQDGTMLRLGDVARVVDGFAEDDRLGFFNGSRAALISVFKTSDQDAIDISDEVKRYHSAKKEKLPRGIGLEIWSDQSRFIRERFDMLVSNGFWGMILVFGTLWFFLNLRLSFWVAMGIPLSFGGGLFVLWACDRSLNMISMFAMIMTLGIVVDDAIVVGENIYNHQKQGGKRTAAAVRATWEMTPPVIGAVTTTIAAFMPLFFVSGIMGKFIVEIPTAVTAILAFSLFESLFILPAHLSHGGLPEFRIPAFADRGSGFVRRLLDSAFDWFTDHIYRPLYLKAIGAKVVVLALAVALLLICAGLVRGGFLPFVFFPKTDSEIIIGKVRFPQGTPVEFTLAAVKKIEGAALALDGSPKTQGNKVVRQIFSVVGQSASEFQGGSGSHIGEVVVELTAGSERRVTSEFVTQIWRENVGEIPDALSLTFGPERHGPGGKPIEIALLGEDYRLLRQVAGEVKRELAEFEDVYDIEDDYQPGKREVRPVLKDRGHNWSVREEDMARQLFQGFAGEDTLKLQRGPDEVKVKIRYPEAQRRMVSTIEAARIRTPSGAELPLTEIADLTVHRGPAQIHRQDKLRVIRVLADVNEDRTPAERVIQHLDSRVFPGLTAKYPGFRHSFEGQQQERRESMGSLGTGFVFGIVAIFTILALIFKSYAQPVIIMMAIPFGCIGAMLGHFILGKWISMMSVFGIVALSGVVVDDSLVLIDRINAGIRRGLTVMESVREAGPARLRAVLLTTLTTWAGLMPLLLETSYQAQFIIPMAVSLSFGLVFATMVTLFLTPCLFLYLNATRRVIQWLLTGTWPSPEEVEPAYKQREMDAEN